MQVAFPLLAGSLVLAQNVPTQHVLGQHGGTAPSTSAADAPRSFTPHSGSALWPYGVTEPHPKSDDPATRDRFPYVHGAGTGLIPFAYGLPLPYGGSLIEAPVADQPAPLPVDNPEASEPQSQANAYATRFRPLYQGPAPVASAPPQRANPDATRFRPLYEGPATFAPVQPQPATTLIFKDGRAPAQVHNYALTATTLYALDGEVRQEIPLSWLNVPATVEANRAAGVEFALPERR